MGMTIIIHPFEPFLQSRNAAEYKPAAGRPIRPSGNPTGEAVSATMVVAPSLLAVRAPLNMYSLLTLVLPADTPSLES